MREGRRQVNLSAARSAVCAIDFDRKGYSRSGEAKEDDGGQEAPTPGMAPTHRLLSVATLHYLGLSAEVTLPLGQLWLASSSRSLELAVVDAKQTRQALYDGIVGQLGERMPVLLIAVRLCHQANKFSGRVSI